MRPTRKNIAMIFQANCKLKSTQIQALIRKRIQIQIQAHQQILLLTLQPPQIQ